MTSHRQGVLVGTMLAAWVAAAAQAGCTRVREQGPPGGAGTERRRGSERQGDGGPRDGSRGSKGQRIISVVPSLTEVAFAVGLGGRVVAVSDYCDYPPEVRALPRVGTYLSPSLEAILALRPDMVLLDEVQTELASALHSAGVGVLRLPIQTVSDVRQALLAVAAAASVPERGRTALARLDAEIRAAESKVHGRSRPRVFFAVDREAGGLRNLVGAGPGTYIDEMIRRAGGVNILADSKVRYARVAADLLLARAPEVIIDAIHASDTRQALADWKNLPSLPAVRQSRVHVLPDRVFVTPGPRLGRALGRLVELLHGHPPPGSELLLRDSHLGATRHSGRRFLWTQR